MCIFTRPSRMTPRTPLAFNRDTLGFEVRNDAGNDVMRWITVGQPGTSIVLEPPAADLGITDDERRWPIGVGVEGGDQEPGPRPCSLRHRDPAVDSRAPVHLEPDMQSRGQND